MKLRYTLVALLAILATSFSTVAAQHDHGHGTPDASGSDMQSLSIGAFYFTITNNGEETDRLVEVETDMADIVEIHNTEMDDGVMKMAPQHDGVEIAPGESIVFEPGSYHVMLIDLRESMLDGEEFTATLHFEKAGEVEITVPISISEPDEFADPVQVGDDIEVSNIWARQAPKLVGPATPEATPGH